MARSGPQTSRDAMKRALFVGSDVYREAAFGKHHPLSIVRVSGVVDVCRMLGWFGPEQYCESPQASLEQLLEFHDADYVEALRAADAGLVFANLGDAANTNITLTVREMAPDLPVVALAEDLPVVLLGRRGARRVLRRRRRRASGARRRGGAWRGPLGHRRGR